MWSEDDTGLDAAIDAVARQQTNGAPGAAFKAQVLARIAERTPHRAWWRRGWTWTPVAMAAAIVLLLIVHNASQAPVPVPNPAPAPQIAAVPAGPTTNDLRPTTNDQRPTTNDQRLTTNAQRPSRAARPSPIDAMAPEHLAVASIVIDPLTAAESMELSELKVPAIDVRPLAVEFGSKN